MILRSSPTSPFGRKVKIVAHMLGLADKIEIERAVPADPNDSLRQQNPLGKMPALILGDGTVLYDSRVIAEYLADLADDTTLFPKNAARWPALRLQALADGIADAAVLQLYETRFRAADARSADWTAYQQGKIDRALDALEDDLPATGQAPHIGEIALAVTLAWFDFRFEGSWREGRPNLVAWLDAAGTRLPGFAETAPTE